MEDMVEEYQEWSSEIVMESSLPQYSTVLKMLNKLIPCETSLVRTLATVTIHHVFNIVQTQPASVESYLAVACIVVMSDYSAKCLNI